MALRMGALSDALIAAGVDAGLAKEAAEEAASNSSRTESKIAALDSRLAVLTWMTATNVALTIAVLFKLFH